MSRTSGPTPERVDTAHLHHRTTFKPQGTVRTKRPMPYTIQNTKRQHRRHNLLRRAAADLIRRALDLSKRSQEGARYLTPRRQRLETSASASSQTTSLWFRPGRISGLSPRAAQDSAPRGGIRAEKNHICAPEGAGGALHVGLSMRGSGEGTLSVRRRLVGALIPLRVCADAPLRQAPQPFGGE